MVRETPPTDPRSTPTTTAPRPGRSDPGSIREEGLDALETLANEHRIAILRTLAEADDPIPFSELRRRVGIDDTGRFNYHLTELRGRFVRKTDGGYELGYAGERIVLAAGDLNPDNTAIAADRTDDDTANGDGSNCPICGEPDCGKLIHVHLSRR